MPTSNLDAYDRRALARIMAKVVVHPKSGCWQFQGALNRLGYGTVGYRGRIAKAHRVTYQLLVGNIPEGLVLDHFACDNRACCNPDHVRLATQRENVLWGSGLAAANAAKTVCHVGHEFTAENTYVARNGKRACRICYRTANRAAYRRKKEKRDSTGAGNATSSPSTEPQEVQS